MKKNNLLFREAWHGMKGYWSISIGLLILYGIIQTVLNFIFPLTTFNFEYGANIEETYNLYYALLTIIINAPLNVGLLIFFLNISKENNIKIDNLFQGFKSTVPIIVSLICTNFLVILGSLMLIVPGVYFFLGYSMTQFVIAENPKISGLEAMSRSDKMMKGNRLKLFFFFIKSFFLLIVGCIPLFLGLFVVIPWITLAYTKFYENLKLNNFSDWSENDTDFSSNSKSEIQNDKQIQNNFKIEKDDISLKEDLSQNFSSQKKYEKEKSTNKAVEEKREIKKKITKESIQKSKDALLNLKEKKLISDEEFNQKIESLENLKFNILDVIKEFANCVKKEINDDIKDLNSLLETNLLSEKDFNIKLEEIKISTIKKLLSKRGISLKMKNGVFTLKSKDIIKIENPDKVITKDLMGTLKEPKIIKGKTEHLFFISIRSLKNKPVIVCYLEGKIVERDVFECIFDDSDSKNKIILSDDDLSIIESYKYNDILKYV